MQKVLKKNIMERGGCVYIPTNFKHTVFYIRITSDLYFRIKDHKEKIYPNSFTAKEKQLKNWKRAWKINLINLHNPNWDDLFLTL
jgi:putative endonuclease